jgi:hypothetical protein
VFDAIGGGSNTVTRITAKGAIDVVYVGDADADTFIMLEVYHSTMDFFMSCIPVYHDRCASAHHCCRHSAPQCRLIASGERTEGEWHATSARRNIRQRFEGQHRRRPRRDMCSPPPRNGQCEQSPQEQYHAEHGGSIYSIATRLRSCHRAVACFPGREGGRRAYQGVAADAMAGAARHWRQRVVAEPGAVQKAQ